MKERMDTQTRLDPGASVLVDGGGQVLSARLAKERNRILRQESPEGEKRTLSDHVTKAKVKELEAWEYFRVFSAVQPGTQPKDLVDTRWVLTWKEARGEKQSRRGWWPEVIRTRTFDWAMWALRDV